MPCFAGVDYLDFDSILTDEEKLAWNTTRQFVDEQIIPIIEEYNREGKFPMQLVPAMAELGLFGATLKGYVRGNVECGVWIGYAGARARRFWVAQFCFGAVGVGDVSDLYVWLGRAKR
jgi:alkylation response protein AidB-like acyl-CoA dehydrogenase